MIGIYRGLVHDALLMINEAGGDLWVVQANTHGPFIEMSRVSGVLDRRVEGTPGVKKAYRYVQYNRQFDFNNRRLGLTITGLDYPYDNGSWIPLTAGQYFSSGHYEAIADVSSGLVIGDRIRLGRDDFLIVGTTSGQVDYSGDPLVYVSITDALSIDRESSSEAILLLRAAQTQSALLPGRFVAAVMIKLQDQSEADKVRKIVSSWGDVRVFSREEQRDFMLNGKLYKLRLQLLAFLIIMLAVTSVVVALSVFTTVIEKHHSIALLKLMGARDTLISGMIVQYAIAVGALGMLVGQILAELIFPHFPRTVVIYWTDIFQLALSVLVVCGASSWFGVLNAMKIRAQEILA
jgi:putative ABC transport system permease protein